MKLKVFENKIKISCVFDYGSKKRKINKYIF